MDGPNRDVPVGKESFKEPFDIPRHGMKAWQNNMACAPDTLSVSQVRWEGRAGGGGEPMSIQQQQQQQQRPWCSKDTCIHSFKTRIPPHSTNKLSTLRINCGRRRSVQNHKITTYRRYCKTSEHTVKRTIESTIKSTVNHTVIPDVNDTVKHTVIPDVNHTVIPDVRRTGP